MWKFTNVCAYIYIDDFVKDNQQVERSSDIGEKNNNKTEMVPILSSGKTLT